MECGKLTAKLRDAVPVCFIEDGKLDIVFTSNLSTNSAIMVNGGLAYSLVIEGAVPFWNQSKVTFRPLDPPLTATSVLAWKRDQPFSLATTKFIKHIQCFLGIDKP